MDVLSAPVELRIPDKLIDVFSGQYRIRGARGGRGSAKTFTFATMIAVRALMFAQSGISGVMLCGREYMASLRDSSFAEIKSAIEATPWLLNQFDIGEQYIRTRCGRVSFVFTGLRVNIKSIKGIANVLIAWVDEAEDVSDDAWINLIPTIRGIDDAELWVTWNPEKEESPTNRRFWTEKPDDACVVHINYDDNPWFPNVLDKARLEDQQRRTQDDYEWIWLGAYRERSDAQVITNYRIVDFEVSDEWAGPYHGLDWGFATDPTAASRVYIDDVNNRLYVSHDFSEVALKLDDTAKELKKAIPGIEAYKILADNARPESVDHVKSNGGGVRENLPFVQSCKKGKGSVEHGLTFIQGFELVVHSRCKQTAFEVKNYSYQLDRLTKKPTNELIDKHNHVIDSIRYALEEVIKPSGPMGVLIPKRLRRG